MPPESEKQTRLKRIDTKLNALGWPLAADGDEPATGPYRKHEIETDSGPADYGLFLNSKLVAIVEAKKADGWRPERPEPGATVLRGLRSPGGGASRRGMPRGAAAAQTSPQTGSEPLPRSLPSLPQPFGAWIARLEAEAPPDLQDLLIGIPRRVKPQDVEVARVELREGLSDTIELLSRKENREWIQAEIRVGLRRRSCRDRPPPPRAPSLIQRAPAGRHDRQRGVLIPQRGILDECVVEGVPIADVGEIAVPTRALLLDTALICHVALARDDGQVET